MAKTIEELTTERDALVGDGSTPLTEEQCNRYEAIEAEVATLTRAADIQKRHAAAKRVVTPAVSHTSAKKDDTLERAFTSYLRTGQANSDIVELRAQSVGTPSAGGYTAPEGFRNKIVDRMKTFGGVANAAETITTSDGNTLNWVTVDDTGNVGEIVAENGTFSSGADLVFGEADLGAYKYMAGGAGNLPLRVSWELLQDSAFDIEKLVSDKMGERIARIQAQHVVRGTGSGEPLGIVTGLTGVEIAADTAGITYADLLHFVHSIDPAYRTGAKWAFNDKSLELIRGLEDDNGRPLLKGTNEGVAGAPGGETLLGYPVVIDQAFVDFDADSNTANWGVFGNLSEGYVVRRVKDVTVVVDPYTRAANGQVQYTVWARMDATQQNTNAYVALTGEA